MAARSLFFLFALLAGSNAFTSIALPRNQHVASPTALDAFQRSSPSTNAVSFLRSDSGRPRRSWPGHSDNGFSHGSLDNDDEKPDETQPKKKKGYQRAEDWDAEQKAGGMSWEQRVQFDGLRMGNGVRQNEILQKHLGSF